MSSEFSKFSSKDRGSKDLTDIEQWRVTMFIITLLVDIFNFYEKVEKGFVEKNYLAMRMHALKLGIMKTKRKTGVWIFGNFLEIKNLLTGLSKKSIKLMGNM